MISCSDVLEQRSPRSASMRLGKTAISIQRNGFAIAGPRPAWESRTSPVLSLRLFLG